MYNLYRKCPNPNNNNNCKVIIEYKSKKYYNSCIRENRLCISCSNQINGRKSKTHYNLSEKGRKSLIESKLGDKNPAKRLDVRNKLKQNHHRKNKTMEESYGYDRAQQIRNKLSIRARGNKNPAKRLDVRKKISNSNKGKSGEHNKDPEKRRKQRIFMIERRKSLYGNNIVWYNKSACKIFNWLNMNYDFNFQHALNGGEFHIKELGYFLDAYDEKRNIVIEFYERFHYNINGNLKQKELEREQEVIEHLNCKFIRINAFDKNNLILENI